jgi:hypothetical protein
VSCLSSIILLSPIVFFNLFFFFGVDVICTYETLDVVIPSLEIDKADSCGKLIGSSVPALDGRRRSFAVGLTRIEWPFLWPRVGSTVPARFFGDVEHLVMMPHQGGTLGRGLAVRLPAFFKDVEHLVMMPHRSGTFGQGLAVRLPAFFMDVEHLS